MADETAKEIVQMLREMAKAAKSTSNWTKATALEEAASEIARCYGLAAIRRQKGEAWTIPTTNAERSPDPSRSSPAEITGTTCARIVPEGSVPNRPSIDGTVNQNALTTAPESAKGETKMLCGESLGLSENLVVTCSRPKGHSGSHSPNSGFNDPLTTAPARGAEELEFDRWIGQDAQSDFYDGASQAWAYQARKFAYVTAAKDAEIKRLRQALQKWSDWSGHMPDCEAWAFEEYPAKNHDKCNCGLRDLLGGQP